MFIKKIEAINFGRYANFSLGPFNKNGIYIIYGVNKDFDGGNGIGKSHFIESIIYSLYGETLRPSLKDVKKYIQRKQTKMSVNVELHEGLIFKRNQTSSASNVEVLNTDNENIAQQRTKTLQKEYIDKIIIPFGMFKFLHYFNPHSIIFFNLPPKQKYQIIEELRGLEILTEMFENYTDIEKKINEEIANINMKTYSLKSEQEQLKIQIGHHTSNVFNAQAVINSQSSMVTQRINTILSNITNIKDNTKHYLSKLQNLSAQLQQKNEELERVKIEYEGTPQPMQRDVIQQYQRQLTMYGPVLKTIQDYLNDPKKCPLCKRDYEFDISEYIKAQLNLDTSYEDLVILSASIKDAISKNEDLQLQHNRISSAYTAVSNSLALIQSQTTSETNNMISNAKSVITNIEWFLNEHNVDTNMSLYVLFKNENINIISMLLSELSIMRNVLIKMNVDTTCVDNIESFLNYEYTPEDIQYNNELLLAKYNSQLKEFDINTSTLRMDSITQDLSNLESSLQNLTKLKSECNILSSELGWSGNFRKALMESYLKDMEKVYNSFVSHIIPQYRLEFKLEQKGREKGINVVVYDDDEPCSYGELCTGEKRLIDICFVLTLASYSSGIIMIDEALDNLSYEMQVKVLEMLREIGRQVFVVSHNKALIDNLTYQSDDIHKLNIVRENGISTIQLG